MADMLRRAAKAIQSAWDDGTDVAANLPPIEFTEAEMTHLASAVLRAIKYEDGTDESMLIDVSNAERVEAVSLALAWDAMIDAALTTRSNLQQES